MSWTESDSTWQIAQRRRIRRIRLVAIAVIGFYALITIAPFIIIGDIRRTISDAPGDELDWIRGALGLLPILLLVMFVLMTTMMIRLLRSERRVAALVPNSDGRVCSRCRILLDEAGDELKCPKCRIQVTHEYIRDFWEQYPHQAGTPSFNRALMEQFSRQPGRRGLWPRIMKWMWDHPYVYWGGVALLMLTYVVISSRASGLPLVRSAISMASMLIPMFGLFLCLPLSKRRVGDSLHCVGCEYVRVAGDVGPSCPECGTSWRGSGAVVRGRLVNPKTRRLIGVAILVLSAGSMVSSFTTGRSFVTVAIPTAILLHQASDAEWQSHRTWKELSRRQLTPAQERRLIEVLTDVRRRGEPMVGPPDRWMSAVLASATTPPEVIDEYHAAGMSARIVSPTDVRLGYLHELNAEFTANDQFLAPGGCAFVLVEGVAIGDNDQVVRRSRTAIRMLKGNSALDPEGRFRYRAMFLPNQIGETTARVTYWHLVGPFKLGSHEFNWNADGTPVLPNSVSWSRRMILDTTFTVAPADD